MGLYCKLPMETHGNVSDWFKSLLMLARQINHESTLDYCKQFIDISIARNEKVRKKKKLAFIRMI